MFLNQPNCSGKETKRFLVDFLPDETLFNKGRIEYFSETGLIKYLDKEEGFTLFILDYKQNKAFSKHFSFEELSNKDYSTIWKGLYGMTWFRDFMENIIFSINRRRQESFYGSTYHSLIKNKDIKNALSEFFDCDGNCIENGWLCCN